MISLRSLLRLAVGFSLGAALLGQCPGASPAQSALSDQTRDLLQPPDTPYLRQWLLCGEFPNQFGSGLATDYLHGEALVHPHAGERVRRPDGSFARWRIHRRDGDIVDLLRSFPGRPTTDVVAYAYRTIDSAAAGRAVLSVGSDDGVKVWLNGQVVLDHAVSRGLTRDEDQVAVTLKTGPNSLLVKVDQGGGDWGFCVRVIPWGNALLMPPRPAGFRALLSAPGNPPLLSVDVDPAWSFLADELPCRVDVNGPGGEPHAERESRTGERSTFDLTGWPEGVYEISVTTMRPDGKSSRATTLWYNGDALTAAAELLRSARRSGSDTREGMVSRMLAEMVRDRLGPDLDRVDPRKIPSIYSPLLEWEELQLPRAAGGVRPGGFIRLAYRDPVDDSAQFCRAYLPPGYQPGVPCPMVVHLHGYNADNPPYINWGVDGRHHDWADRYGVIVLEPMGRYNTTYWGIGEKDVIRSIQLARQQFSVDADRVYLVGESMGGGGAWYVGTRHPELFAAIAPSFGGRDYHADLSAAEVERLSSHDRFRLEARSMFAQAESLLTTPVFVNHGDRDDLVKVEYSRYAVRMLQRWGYSIRYWEHQGSGHGGFNVDDELFRWLLEHKRVAHPRHVRLRAADLSTASAHWVRVEQFQDPWKLVEVDAQIIAPNRIRLNTSNVKRVTLTPGGSLIDAVSPLDVIWNGTMQTFRIPPPEITLDTAPGLDPPGRTPEKSPRLPGHMEDVFRTPFVLVEGTASHDPVMRGLVHRAVDRYASLWHQAQHVWPRLMKDFRVTREIAAGYSLVLVGGPSENLVSRSLGDRFPLRKLADGFEIDGRRVGGKNALAQVVYPNPWNPLRYAAMIAPSSAASMFYVDQLPADLDIALVDGKIQPDLPAAKAGIDAGSPIRLLGGQFDNRWHWNEALMEYGDPALRARCPRRNAPVKLTTYSNQRVLHLGDVLETAPEGTFTALMHNQNRFGQPITLKRKRYASGIASAVSPDPSGAVYVLRGAGWRRLIATIGIETAPRLSPEESVSTLVRFLVEGDGVQIYRSPMLHWYSPPLTLDVDVRGVRRLKLRIQSGAVFHNAATSVDWADLRLIK